jgi:hypothetical protein
MYVTISFNSTVLIYLLLTITMILKQLFRRYGRVGTQVRTGTYLGRYGIGTVYNEN